MVPSLKVTPWKSNPSVKFPAGDRLKIMPAPLAPPVVVVPYKFPSPPRIMPAPGLAPSAFTMGPGKEPWSAEKV